MPLNPAPIQEPIAGLNGRVSQVWVRWFDGLRSILHVAPTYTVAQLPAAAPAGSLAFVSDESGGAVLAFSDGTNWRRSTDRAICT
jgi:hypothetical protein